MKGQKINSRSKGNKNERELAALFKQWTGRDFARTPSSGGLQWKNSNSKGDIVCTKEGHYFPFCIEAKSYRDINFQHLLYLPKPKIIEFWIQCKRDAKKAGKIPILFMRYNGMPKNFHFVVLEGNTFRHLREKLQLVLPSNELSFIDENLKYNLIIIPSTVWFQYPYKQIKEAAKSHIGYGKKKK